MSTITVPDFTPSATIEPTTTWDDKPAIVVRVEFPNAGVDRKDGHGWQLPDTPAGRKLAARLVRAIHAGAVFTTEPIIGTDVNGRTFIHARANVLGRMMNADLRRLGY